MIWLGMLTIVSVFLMGVGYTLSDGLDKWIGWLLGGTSPFWALLLLVVCFWLLSRQSPRLRTMGICLAVPSTLYWLLTAGFIVFLAMGGMH